MELGLGNTLLAGDPRLVDHIVGEVKSQGIFDQFRKECIADVDTKPAYQNLRTRVESSVNSFLDKQTWKADLNKNQLRETLRKHIVEAPYLDAGVERIVDQVVNPKVYSVFMPQIEDVVYKFLGLERPKNRRRNGPCGFKDLLPKDLDPVSPESDKNSLKDVSLDSVDANVEHPEPRDKDPSISSTEQSHKDVTDNNSNDRDNRRNGNAELQGFMDEMARSSAAVNLINSGKSEEKPEEEEEDSPMFEPIDIMNLNESYISNDSRLSGISELTSHRSRSPDFSNEASRDNMDFSNQDSQFSKVSSDSRLSIVTDFGSSNHASTPMSDALKDEKTESKYSKDNFKAVREFESGKGNKDGKLSYESERSKDNTPSNFKFIRQSLSSKETSRDGMESGTKDSQRNDSRARRSDPKDSKKERDKDNLKKQNNHDAKSSERTSKKTIKEKTEEKSREKEKEKKETEKKDKIEGKETKDLKDIYKEKIRELREKKELTEKEKLSKDKDSKATKEKRDSSKDKRDSKEHKSVSSKSSSRSDSKKSSNLNESKGARCENRDKGKRDERRYSKDHKSKSFGVQSDEKSEAKRPSRSDDKSEKSEMKESKQKSVVKKDGKCGDQRESKSEADRERKRREEKKAKAKDDHSSLRKNSEDRRSTDRDGSNGSNGKSSQKSGSSSDASSAKPSASNLPKESTNTSNSSSETSDSIEEPQNEKLRLSMVTKNSEIVKNSRKYDSQGKILDLGQNKISLPIKKRPFGEECGGAGNTGEVLMKKPKFAKNFQEAKRLMKIRRKMEKEKIRRQREMEKNVDVPVIPEIRENVEKNDLELVPDDERVQIIEVCDEEYDEPYPEIQSNFTLEERSQIILGAESIFTSDLTVNEFNAKSTLSQMELSIRQSFTEMISDKKIEETEHSPKTKQNTTEESEIKSTVSVDCQETEILSNAGETLRKDSTESEPDKPEVVKLSVQSAENEVNTEKASDDESCTKGEETIRKQEDAKTPKIPQNVEVSKSLKNNEQIESKVVEDKVQTLEPPIIELQSSVKKIASEVPTVTEVEAESCKLISEKTTETCNKLKTSCQDAATVEEDSAYMSDNSPCLYFTVDNERLNKFTRFMEALEKNEEYSNWSAGPTADTVASVGADEVVSSLSKTMAPPKPKRKYSTSPLTDILVNNTNNNNDAHKITAAVAVDEVAGNNLKKRKLGRPKKQRSSANLCGQQNLLNGENFVMPLSPESDVSATSEKIPSNPLKDEKSRPRGSNQRYTSDDLYKPRPLFASSSRRSRRSNPA